MAVITRTAAQVSSDTIANETVPSANTASRVGTLFRGFADSTTFIADPDPTRVITYDFSTTVSSGNTGSRRAPYATMQAAANALTGNPGGPPTSGVIRVADGSDGDAFTITDYKFIAIVAEGGNHLALAQPGGKMAVGYATIRNHAEVYGEGLYFPTIDMDTCRFYGQNCVVGTAFGTGSTLKLWSTMPHPPTDGSEHPTLGNTQVAALCVRGYHISGYVESTDGSRPMILEFCEIAGNHITSAGDLWMDEYSLQSAERNGVTFTSVGGTLRVLDDGRAMGLPITTTASVTVAGGNEYFVRSTGAYTITLGTSGSPFTKEKIRLRRMVPSAHAITITNGGGGGGNIGPSGGTLPPSTALDTVYVFDGTNWALDSVRRLR